MEDVLYHSSGLLSVSGSSADTRNLCERADAASQSAIDLFTFCSAGEVTRLAVTLGGPDAPVLTAGISEHQPMIRARVVERLAWPGARLDMAANAASGFSIAAGDSRVEIRVMEMDEEQVIAEEALLLLSAADPDQGRVISFF
jgi:acetate kinase